jgi:hypothetical protein
LRQQRKTAPHATPLGASLEMWSIAPTFQRFVSIRRRYNTLIDIVSLAFVGRANFQEVRRRCSFPDTGMMFFAGIEMKCRFPIFGKATACKNAEVLHFTPKEKHIVAAPGK